MELTFATLDRRKLYRSRPSRMLELEGTGKMLTLQHGEDNSKTLGGTTLRVYRFIFQRAGRPVGVHEVQDGLGLSSPSVAHYHIRKLVDRGLVKEESGGYVTRRFLFENMIIVRGFTIPLQATCVAIFLSSLFLSLTVFRAELMSSGYVFALFAIALAAGIFAFETAKSLRQKNLQL